MYGYGGGCECDKNVIPDTSVAILPTMLRSRF